MLSNAVLEKKTDLLSCSAARAQQMHRRRVRPSVCHTLVLSQNWWS